MVSNCFSEPSSCNYNHDNWKVPVNLIVKSFNNEKNTLHLKKKLNFTDFWQNLSGQNDKGNKSKQSKEARQAVQGTHFNSKSRVSFWSYHLFSFTFWCIYCYFEPRQLSTWYIFEFKYRIGHLIMYLFGRFCEINATIWLFLAQFCFDWQRQDEVIVVIYAKT